MVKRDEKGRFVKVPTRYGSANSLQQFDIYVAPKKPTTLLGVPKYFGKPELNPKNFE